MATPPPRSAPLLQGIRRDQPKPTSEVARFESSLLVLEILHNRERFGQPGTADQKHGSAPRETSRPSGIPGSSQNLERSKSAARSAAIFNATPFTSPTPLSRETQKAIPPG